MKIRDKVKNKMANVLLFRDGPCHEELKEEQLSAPRVSWRKESGVTLVIVLVLAAVSLTLITALLYLVTVGSQTSGVQKRYRTSLEACVAGADIVEQVIDVRGDPTTINPAVTSFLTGLTGLNAAQNVDPLCQGTALASGATTTFNGIGAKIVTSSASWNSKCGTTSMSVNPKDSKTYDFTFQLGTSPRFNVYAKIVDMLEGNTLDPTGSGGSSHKGGKHWIKDPVVGGGGSGGSSGEINSISVPYLYTFEMDCVNADNTNEQAKLSVLYQY